MNCHSKEYLIKEIELFIILNEIKLSMIGEPKGELIPQSEPQSLQYYLEGKFQNDKETTEYLLDIHTNLHNLRDLQIQNNDLLNYLLHRGRHQRMPSQSSQPKKNLKEKPSERSLLTKTKQIMRILNLINPRIRQEESEQIGQNKSESLRQQLEVKKKKNNEMMEYVWDQELDGRREPVESLSVVRSQVKFAICQVHMIESQNYEPPHYKSTMTFGGNKKEIKELVESIKFQGIFWQKHQEEADFTCSPQEQLCNRT